jgi:hypothetical protein
VIVAVLARDLWIATRIADAGTRAGVEVRRYDDPDELPPSSEVRLLLVDWSERGGGWGDRLTDWGQGSHGASRPRIVLFGPHADLAAHADARTAGLGPMLARSKLMAELARWLEVSEAD